MELIQAGVPVEKLPPGSLPPPSETPTGGGGPTTPGPSAEKTCEETTPEIRWVQPPGQFELVPEYFCDAECPRDVQGNDQRCQPTPTTGGYAPTKCECVGEGTDPPPPPPEP